MLMKMTAEYSSTRQKMIMMMILMMMIVLMNMMMMMIVLMNMMMIMAIIRIGISNSDSDVDEVLTDEHVLDNNANAEDYDEEDVDDDDDDEYITEESDNQEDDDVETELPTDHVLSGTRLRTAHSSGQDVNLLLIWLWDNPQIR